jgi:F420-0:gamma-glutamyl ligase
VTPDPVGDVAAMAAVVAGQGFDATPAIGGRVLSARVHTESAGEHRHTPVLGDAFYDRGTRMRHATCSTCGLALEPRRA